LNCTLQTRGPGVTVSYKLQAIHATMESARMAYFSTLENKICLLQRLGRCTILSVYSKTVTYNPISSFAICCIRYVTLLCFEKAVSVSVCVYVSHPCLVMTKGVSP